ncbi:MAG: PilZ domain-containing protein, partial [Alphaproteobacteria bacterium]|nr:PilZ domain-containing protein [Alphaproteobacteria bacterium]
MAIEYKFRGFSAKNDRRDRRIPVDLPAIVDDEDVTVKDIAFGGMRFVAELDADLELGDEVEISIDLGRGKKLRMDGLIVWFDGVDQFGVTFTGLTP